MPANTPCINLERPDHGTADWDIACNNNFAIIDQAICQLSSLIMGVSGASTIQDMIHDSMITELSSYQAPLILKNGREIFTLTATDISNKYVTLNITPDITEEYPHLGIEHAPSMVYGVDYVLLNNNQINWNPVNIQNDDLSDVLEEGDEIFIEYNYK
jgi:hypothetical protein